MRIAICLPLIILFPGLQAFGQLYPRLESPELVYLNSAMPPDLDAAFVDGNLMMDASLATIKRDAETMDFYFTSYNKITKFNGPLADPFRTKEAGWPRSETQLFPNDAEFETGKIQAWIPSIHKLENGDFLGFVHIEDGRLCMGNPPPLDFYCPDTKYRIGLAYSTNGGWTWKYCGDIIKPHSENGIGGGPGGASSVIGGVPYLMVGNYVYVYFNEFVNGGSPYQRNSVARAPLADVLTKAQTCAQTGSCAAAGWIKYNGNTGGWNGESGLTGTASNIIPPYPGYPYSNGDFHSDAIYSTVLNRYFISAEIADGYGGSLGLFIYSSSDGVNWENPVLVDNTPGNIFPYSTFLSLLAASDDTRETGREFYILYPRKNNPSYWIDDLYKAKYVAYPEISPLMSFSINN